MHVCSVVPAVLFAIAVLIPFEKDGKWGYKDSGGKVVIPARYEMAREFSREGIAAVVDDEGWVYIDRTGQPVIRPLVIDNGPDYFREGVARFKRDGKVGFFDRRGKVVIQPGYAYARPFFEGRAAVCEGCTEVEDGEHRSVRGGKWGFIGRDGKLVIPLHFAQADDFESGRARVRNGVKWRYIDRNGRPRRGRRPGKAQGRGFTWSDRCPSSARSARPQAGN